MKKGYAVELKNKFAWAEDSVMIFTTHGWQVILLGEYDDDSEPFFILLDFQGAMCTRSASTDCCPDMHICGENFDASYISVLTESSWNEDAHKKYRYRGTPNDIVRLHYVISNHDVFHEVLAKSFTETRITKIDENYNTVKSCFLFSRAQLA
jgi:hypothetical protein